MADEISLGLTRDQALVFFDWLLRTDHAGEPAGFADQAEQRVLWDISASLETLLTAPLAPDYRAQLERARASVRDSDKQLAGSQQRGKVHGILGATATTSGYHLVLASSVGDRDGVGLELTRADGSCAAEVFESTDTGQRVVNVFDEDVPLDAIEWLLAEAKARL